MKPTFKQQFDKLTAAYIRGDVNPFNPCNCFVGNLLNQSLLWAEGRDLMVNPLDGEVDWKDNNNESFNSLTWCNGPYKSAIESSREIIDIQSNGLYTPKEIYNLERIFLKTYLREGGNSRAFEKTNPLGPTEIDENALFIAFDITIEALRQVHLSKGEQIDSPYTFTKRQLQHA